MAKLRRGRAIKPMRDSRCVLISKLKCPRRRFFCGSQELPFEKIGRSPHAMRPVSAARKFSDDTPIALVLKGGKLRRWWCIDDANPIEPVGKLRRIVVLIGKQFRRELCRHTDI